MSSVPSSPRRCGIEGCGRPNYSTGLCQTHYNRLRAGKDLYAPITIQGYKRGAVCIMQDCVRPIYRRGYCTAHYQRTRHGQDLTRPIEPRNIPLQQYIETHAHRDDNGCLIWTGAHNKAGYGLLPSRQKQDEVMAHRAAYALANGPIPAELEVHHLCRNKSCVEILHLTLVSPLEHRRAHHKIPHQKCLYLIELYASGRYTQNQLATLFSISQSHVSRIINGQIS